jgi:hypothetical protein
MFLTCAVRLFGHQLTESVRSFHGAGDAGHFGLAAQSSLGADLARTRVHLAGERVELIDHRVHGVLEHEDLARLTLTVIFLERSPRRSAVATSAMFLTCAVRLLAMKLTLSVRSFHVPATPGTCA